ncbi:unnamed protein product, partial [Cuscuta campestris]
MTHQEYSVLCQPQLNIRKCKEGQADTGRIQTIGAVMPHHPVMFEIQ